MQPKERRPNIALLLPIIIQTSVRRQNETVSSIVHGLYDIFNYVRAFILQKAVNTKSSTDTRFQNASKMLNLYLQKKRLDQIVISRSLPLECVMGVPELCTVLNTSSCVLQCTRQ